ncbi:MAG: transglutaminase family protein [Gemmatimonadetes bacterium]|nr:transglutaminase family protein [Gemmatimonadota bacterium]
MNYRITHQSHYEYAETVSLSHNQARLNPRSFFNQTCLNSHITINPQPAFFRERKDFFGNRTAYFSIEQSHNILSVTAESDVHIVSQTQLTSDMPWETVCHILKTTTDPDLLSVRQFVLDSPKATTVPELIKYAEPSFSKDRPFIEAVSDLTQRIYSDFEYVPGFTTISTPLSDVFKHRKGVCQDFAHLAIGCLRAMGLAARYISGYLETLPSPDTEHLIGADASHAWFSVYLPNHGWIDFDPTNNLIPGDDRHITLAWGRDFADVTPLKGVVLGGGQHALTVSVTVEPIEGKFTLLQPPS